MENYSDKVFSQENSLIKKIKPFLISLLFIFIFLKYLYPIYYGRDTDIFWHLKTGDIILNEHRILTSDPFTYTPKDPIREKILATYWVSDVILYASYKMWGFTGLAVLRSTILCLTILIVCISILKRGFFISIILSLILGFALLPMSAIRPNLFSFLFVAAMIFFIEKYKQESRRRYQIALFIVMLFWANMHGGYIVGVGILFIYIITEIIVLLFPLKKKKTLKESLSICLTAGAAILATFINPSDISPFLIAGDLHLNPAHKPLMSHIETEMSFFKNVNQYANETTFLALIITGFILVYTALNLTRKRTGLAEISIVLTLLILSIISIRILPIFMIAGLIIRIQYI
jgi:hypothetical protein